MKKVDEISNKTLILFGLGLLIRWSGKQVTKITKYFPFSLISDRWYLHYNNREITLAWDIISDAWMGTGTYFHILSANKDNNFVYFHGRFEQKKQDKIIEKFKSKIEKKVGEGNIFLKKNDDGTYNLNIIIESLNIWN